ncbi:MAG: putative sugar O-methyltransferase [Ignavibacteriaceae bacterium]
MTENIELLDAILDDQSKTPSIYSAGGFWVKKSKSIVNGIQSKGLLNFRSDASILNSYGGCYSINPTDNSDKLKLMYRLFGSRFSEKLFKSHNRLINKYYQMMREYRGYYIEDRYSAQIQLLKKRFDFPNTMLNNVREYITIGNEKISLDYLFQIIRIANFADNLNFSKISSVLEIGGGYGSAAHLFMSFYKNIKKYIYIDIPPMIYIATEYLEQFDEFSVVNYLETKNKNEIKFEDNDKREIIMLCPWQLPNIKSQVDLFYNAISFQEIEITALKNYINLIENTILKNNGDICLTYYQGGDYKITRKKDEIISLFANYCFKEITPAIEEKELPNSLPHIYLHGKMCV